MDTLQLLYFDAGGGHRSAATALEVALEREGQWQTKLTSLQHILDPIDPVRRLTSKRLEDVYNLLLRRGWTRGSAHLLAPLHAAIRRFHPEIVRLLEDHWRKTRPAMAVSVVPHFNRAICESLHGVDPDTPLVTILTDFADLPPYFWIDPPQDEFSHFFICGTSRAREQALAIGVPPERVLRTSGMIVHPRFYEAPAVDQAHERARLGLIAELPTGLVLFGGHGSMAIREIAERLDTSGIDLQLILMCGWNRTLEDDLRRVPGRKPRVVVGFTSEVPHYMQLADFFVGKAGPGCLSEALLMNLPVIVERNARTMPQERYNVEWVLENGVGIAVRDFCEIAGAVEELLLPGQLSAYRQRASALENRAVFEIPSLLRQILERRSARVA
jgi:Glycosyltransferase family 28 C-terminal domain